MEAKQYKEFWNLIDFLHENELLEFILLIGSWAEYLYAQSGLLPGFTENLRTLDVDFLIENKNIDEEYEKAKKIFNEEAKRLKNEINSTSGMVKNSLELTLKNLERRRAEIFERYLYNNLKSLEELK